MNDAHAASDRNSPDIDASVAHNARVWNYWLGAGRGEAAPIVPLYAGAAGKP